jgi:hypothetical protein
LRHPFKTWTIRGSVLSRQHTSLPFVFQASCVASPMIRIALVEDDALFRDAA